MFSNWESLGQSSSQSSSSSQRAATLEILRYYLTPYLEEFDTPDLLELPVPGYCRSSPLRRTCNSPLPDRLYDRMSQFVETFKNDKTYISVELNWKAELLVQENIILAGPFEQYNAELIHKEPPDSRSASPECVIIENDPENPQDFIPEEENISRIREDFICAELARHITVQKKFVREKKFGLTEVYKAIIELSVKSDTGKKPIPQSLQLLFICAHHSGENEPNISYIMQKFTRWLYVAETKVRSLRFNADGYMV